MQYVQMLIQLLVTGEVDGTALPIWFVLLIIGVPLSIAIFLWLFPLTISKAIIPHELNQPFESTNPLGILTVLISAMGLFFLYYAISETAYWLIVFVSSAIGTSNGVPIGLPENADSYSLSTALDMAMALIMIFKSKTIAKALMKKSN